MVLLLVEGSQALCVDDNNWQLLANVCLAVENFFPDPETFRAWVDGRTDVEAFDLLPFSLYCFHKQLVFKGPL